MKIVETLLLVLGAALAAGSPECAAMTTVGTPLTPCKEQCETALALCKKQQAADGGKAALKAGKTGKQLGDEAQLIACINKNTEEACNVPALVRKVTKPFYKTAWFIALMSVLAALALLGAVYHLMGHPGLPGTEGPDSGAQPPDSNTVDSIMPEDAERLM